MNRLVEHMEKHHDPMGNALQFVRVEVLIEETGWSREEIFTMTREANEADLLTVSYNSKGGRVGADMMEPENLDLVGIWNDVYKKLRVKG